MKYKLNKILLQRIITLVALFIISFIGYREIRWNQILGSTVLAVGDLTVDWGISEGDPIFVVNNLVPGENEVRSVEITNSASVIRSVGIKGLKTSGSNELADQLEIIITDGTNNIYGGSAGVKKLADFFEESEGINGVFLLNINPTDTKTINFEVRFPSESGNEYQNLTLVFDLTIGITIDDIPDACDGIAFTGSPIFGTEGRDVLRGTNGNDLIFGFEGNDTISSGNGDDCIVGGLGNDNLSGGNGDDMVMGSEGDDDINGINGQDILIGGEGNDDISGGNNDDTLRGEGGEDDLDGDNGDDRILGGSEDDELKGGLGNDNLVGEDGTDSARGDLGRDTCLAETTNRCEL